MKRKNKIGDVNTSGTVQGTDGSSIQTFEVQVYDDSGTLIDDQTFTNGIWTLDAIQGYGYLFSSSSAYGAAELDGKFLVNNYVVQIPLNVPEVANAGNNYLPIAIAGLALLVFLAADKNNKKNNAVGKLKVDDVLPYIVIGGAVLLFTAGKSLLQDVGIVDSPSTTALNTAETSPTSFWNPNFYQQFSTQSVPLDPTSAANDVETILDAYGFFSTSFAQIQGVFNSYQTQSQVSYLAYIFSQQEEGADLLTYLRSGLWPFALTDTEVEELNTFASKLPTN